MDQHLNRRRFIRLAGLTAAGLGLSAACSAPAAPTSKPAASKPAETKPTAASQSAPAAQSAATKPATETKPAATANLRGGVPANPGAKGTVKFIHVWDGTRQPLMEKQISDFQALWPDIKVDAELISQQGMNEKYLTSIAGGSPPDAIMLNHDQVPAFGGRNALTTLDTYLKRDGLNGDDLFYPSDWKLANFRGQPVSMPLATSGGWYMLFWNQDLLKQNSYDPAKPPKTWQELDEISKKVNKVDGSKINLIAMDVTWHPNYPMFKEWLYTNNGKLISDDGKKATFAEAEGLQTLKWMYDATKLNGGYGAIQALRAELGSSREAWYGGRTIFNIDGVWIFKQAKDANPNLNFTGGLLPANGANSSAKSVNVADTGWGYAIPKGAKNADAAWEWVKYATAGEGNLNFFKAQTRPTPVRKNNEDPFFAQNNPVWSTVQGILKDAVTYPLSGVQAQINKRLTDMQEEAFLDKKPVEQALKDAAADVQKLLDDWYSRQG
ncbi:MAG: extracellular solute-binding protein [Chloroflexi bacterium]|nr:extracellular solute-binding protein [Chloroflexota bacterium]